MPVHNLTPFYFDHIDASIVVMARLGLAAILGLILGVGRERLKKSAGMRTHMVVCLGSAIFILCPILVNTGGDGMSRVIQGITQGIGFLGAGTIIKLSDRDEVRGLTTAASTWLTAAIGVACGMGEIYLALIGASVAWLVLVPLGRFEKRVEVRRNALAATKAAAKSESNTGQ